MNFHSHETAIIDEGAKIGEDTKIWHWTHVSGASVIGKECSFGQNVFIANGVTIGDNVKVQNNVSIYEGTIIEDDVFLGPSCVLTNVTNPRSQVVRKTLYEKTILRRGCSIGANSTVVCGIVIGRYAFVAAGAVITKDVPDYALMVGVPARQKGWMSRHGHQLKSNGEEKTMACPESGLRYKEKKPDVLKCLDLDEDATLPENMAVGSTNYNEFKK